MTDSVTSLFTFGYGQQCPYTGKELGDHYALVTAPDRSSARLFMNTAFKRNWAFEHDSPTDPKIAPYVPRMTLHITVNLVPGQPMPPGFDYSRADDGEQPGPVAGRIPPHFEDGRAVAEADPPWNPQTGFFEPGRVPELVGDDLPSGPVEIDPDSSMEAHYDAEMDRARRARPTQRIGTAECGCPLYPFPEGRGAADDEIVDHLDGCRAQEDLA